MPTSGREQENRKEELLHSVVSLLRGSSVRRGPGERHVGTQVLPSLIAASLAEVSPGMWGVFQLGVIQLCVGT